MFLLVNMLFLNDILYNWNNVGVQKKGRPGVRTTSYCLCFTWQRSWWPLSTILRKNVISRTVQKSTFPCKKKKKKDMWKHWVLTLTLLLQETARSEYQISKQSQTGEEPQLIISSLNTVVVLSIEHVSETASGPILRDFDSRGLRWAWNRHF